MPNNLKHYKNMVLADSNHAGRGLGGLELEPVGSQPELADVSPEHFEGRAATTEGRARAAFGMLDDLSDPFAFGDPHLRNRRPDWRAQITVTAALGFACLAAVIALWALAPGWGRSAALTGAFNDPTWCSGFSGLSCKQDKDTGKNDRSHR